MKPHIWLRLKGEQEHLIRRGQPLSSRLSSLAHTQGPSEALIFALQREMTSRGSLDSEQTISPSVLTAAGAQTTEQTMEQRASFRSRAEVSTLAARLLGKQY